MSALHALKVLAAMDRKAAAAKVVSVLARRVKQRFIGALMRNHCTYPPSYGQVPLARRLPALAVTDDDGSLRRRALLAASHTFDLLGSGPRKVVHPAAKYPDWRDIIAAGHHRGNRKRAASLLAMITTPGYVPVDWHVDFRSGYRWPVRVWGGATAYGHRHGVDVKVPWELGRLQHLPHLALAYAAQADERLATEFHDQVLDFLGANPPGWGCNGPAPWMWPSVPPIWCWPGKFSPPMAPASVWNSRKSWPRRCPPMPAISPIIWNGRPSIAAIITLPI